jgi:O-antigen/teichoic acid export membrane protein
MSVEIFPLPKKIIKNTLYNTIGNWTLMGLNFLIIPFIIGKLGVQLYGGVWVIGIMVISSAALLDFGLGVASIKFVSEYNAKNQYDKINEFVSTGVISYSIFGFLLMVLVVLFGKHLLLIVGVPPSFLSDAYFVLIVSVAILVTVNTLSPLTTIVASLQRMDITNMVAIATTILNICQIIFVLENNLGIRSLIVGYFLINLLSSLCLIFWSYRLMPNLKFKYYYASWSVFKKVWNFGFNLQISRLSQIIVFQFDKIFALHFFGASSAAYYEVAVKVSTLARNIPLVLTSALLPVASEMDAKNEVIKVRMLFERGSKYLIITGTLLLGFIFIESHLIIQTWMGKALGKEGIDTASSVIKFLVVGYFMNMATGIASTIAAGIDRTDIERNVGIISIFVSPIMSIVLIFTVGYYGIALSTMLLLALGAIYYMIQFIRIIENRLTIFLKMFLKPLAGLIAAVVVNELIRYFVILSDINSRLEGIILLSIFMIIFFSIYFTILLLIRTFDDYDKSIFVALYKKIFFKKS